MKNIYEILKEFGLELPAEKKADFEKAWKNYYKLCNLSARDFFTNVIVEAGLNSPFEDGCMEKLVDKFEKKAFNR